MTENTIRLVADVGGTNIRLGLCQPGDQFQGISDIQKISCADFNSLAEALQCYLSSQNLPLPQQASIAVAGPVQNDTVKLTNLPWQFSQRELEKHLKLDKLVVINDFEAIALAIPHLNKTDYTSIGGGTAVANTPITALGAGTGLGVAILTSSSHTKLDNSPGTSYQAFSTEGGHTTIAPANEVEQAIFNHFAAQGHYLSREFFLSGRGLQNIYSALAAIRGVTAHSLQPADIQVRASESTDPICEQALEIFCGLFGSACGDQALATGARGGVYIAGGMVKKFLPFFKASSFRERFENKGPMRHYVEAISTNVITREHAALLGAASAVF
ncbi:MAG: glucokinase [Pseudomonadales bacterium]